MNERRVERTNTTEQIKLLTGHTAQPNFLKMLTWIAVNHDQRIRFIDTLRAFHFGNNFLVEVAVLLLFLFVFIFCLLFFFAENFVWLVFLFVVLLLSIFCFFFVFGVVVKASKKSAFNVLRLMY